MLEMILTYEDKWCLALTFYRKVYPSVGRMQDTLLQNLAGKVNDREIGRLFTKDWKNWGRT